MLLPMFPLGSVLFPAMPLALRVFEERYLAMLASVLQEEPSDFGVVLIERGQEVGGGDGRFGIGTVARIAQLQADEGFIGLMAQGVDRVEVVEWMPDDPYPSAEVRVLDELVWDDGLAPLKDRAEDSVRRAIAIASEYVELQWPVDVELDSDPVSASWQLAAIAPLGEMDQVGLLKATSTEELLTQLIERADEVETALRG